MRPRWAESSKMSSCLWIWCHLHPLRWPVNYHVVLLLKWSLQALKLLERWWRWLHNPGRIILIFLWIEEFKRQARETLGWYFHACGLPEEPREAKGLHVQHRFPGLSHERPGSAGSLCWINNDNWISSTLPGRCRDRHKVHTSGKLSEQR